MLLVSPLQNRRLAHPGPALWASFPRVVAGAQDFLHLDTLLLGCPRVSGFLP